MKRLLIIIFLITLCLGIKAQCVYLIENPQYDTDGNPIICLKIGYATSWERRAKAYRSYIPNYLLHYLTPDDASRTLETSLHRKFKKFQIKVNSGATNTEWFYYDQSIVDYIKSLPKYSGN